MSKKALGRGLSTLLPSRSQNDSSSPDLPPESPDPELPAGATTELPVEKIKVNPFQPRTQFDPGAMEQLVESIRANGIIQPLIVRRSGEQYELIAGERRFRAAQELQLESVPVRVMELEDQRMLEVALVENIQRADLNPIEEAEAYRRLNEDAGLSHEEIGSRTGKDRTTISNSIRLLQLPKPVQEWVSAGKLSAGHARALLKIRDPRVILQMADLAIVMHWNVRQMETEALKLMAQVAGEPKTKPAPAPAMDPNVTAAVRQMEQALGTKVKVSGNPAGRGRIEIEFYNAEDLDRIYSAITSRAN